jgi:serine/threonine-protein kinase
VSVAAEHGTGIGTRLDRWLLESPRSWRAIVDVFIDIGQELGAIHAAGGVHPDIRIENIVVGSDGRASFLDSKAAAAEGSASGTGLRTAAVSVEQRLLAAEAIDAATYLAPEQFRGGVADARSNQFAFCVALYRALYRQMPFDHEWAVSQGGQYTRRRTPLGSIHFNLKVESFDRTTLMNLAKEVLCENIRPAPDGVDIPVWLDRVVQRGLRADADDRYKSMRELIDDVAEELGDVVKSRLGPRRRPVAKWAVIGGLGLLLLLGILAKVALNIR